MARRRGLAAPLLALSCLLLTGLTPRAVASRALLASEPAWLQPLPDGPYDEPYDDDGLYDEVFLFPINVCGPNNQKRDIRNFAALATELDAKLMLTGVFKHHIDNKRLVRLRQLSQQTREEATLPSCFAESKQGYMPFVDILDREPFDSMIGAATVEELKARGWDGELDAIVVDGAPGVYERNLAYVHRAMAAANVTLARDAARITVKSPLACSADRIASLKSQLRPYRFVAIVKVLITSTVTPDLEVEARLDGSTLEGCPATVFKTTRMLRPAPWIRAAAKAFVNEKLGGEPYLAMHVRPYPDKCLQAWHAGDAQPGAVLSVACSQLHATLHDRVAPCAAGVAKQAGLSKVFLMTHPMILPQVSSLLQQAGFTDIVTVDSHDIARLAGCHDYSSTFLSMVEEEIAVQATQFIGTRSSSITQSLVFERLGAGKNGTNAFWESMQC